MLRSRWALGTTSTIIYLKVNRHYSLSLSVSVSHPPFLCLSLLFSDACDRWVSPFSRTREMLLPYDFRTATDISTGYLSVTATTRTSCQTSPRERRPPVAKRARDDIRNDDPPSRDGDGGYVFRGGSVLPRFLGTTSWSTARRFRSSSLLVSRLAVLSRLSLPPSRLGRSFPAPRKTPAIYTLRM